MLDKLQFNRHFNWAMKAETFEVKNLQESQK